MYSNKSFEGKNIKVRDSQINYGLESRRKTNPKIAFGRCKNEPKGYRKKN